MCNENMGWMVRSFIQKFFTLKMIVDHRIFVEKWSGRLHGILVEDRIIDSFTEYYSIVYNHLNTRGMSSSAIIWYSTNIKQSGIFLVSDSTFSAIAELCFRQLTDPGSVQYLILSNFDRKKDQDENSSCMHLFNFVLCNNKRTDLRSQIQEGDQPAWDYLDIW